MLDFVGHCAASAMSGEDSIRSSRSPDLDRGLQEVTFDVLERRRRRQCGDQPDAVFGGRPPRPRSKSSPAMPGGSSGWKAAPRRYCSKWAQAEFGSTPGPALRSLTVKERSHVGGYGADAAIETSRQTSRPLWRLPVVRWQELAVDLAALQRGWRQRSITRADVLAAAPRRRQARPDVRPVHGVCTRGWPKNDVVPQGRFDRKGQR